ncbi:hypothetical protein ACEN9X_18665 [Mucilaginibacter sp. Mucisp86]|uniref:hypothetical protein n=1 Tax=Mucilaginibacter sp. Mucisp86 TaxID=3243060 RepID=UPI0039B6E73C
MKKWKARYKALFAIGLYLVGAVIAGLAYTEPIFGPGLGSFMFCLGGVMSVAGLFCLIKIFTNKIFRRA